MKKLFFSAIALVAFSSVSMGNTGITEKTANNEKEKETKVLLFDSQCLTYAANKVEALEAQGGTLNCEMREYHFWRNYNRCLDKSVCAGQ